MKAFTGWMLAVAVALMGTPGAVWASKVAPAAAPSELKVLDGGHFFSSDGIKQANQAFNGPRGLMLTVETFEKIPAAQQADFEKVKSDPAKKSVFFTEWARSEAKGEKARGVYVLICRSPGEVRVIADREAQTSGFGASKEKELIEILTSKLGAAAKEEAATKQEHTDAALVATVKYVGDAIPKMVASSVPTNHSDRGNHAAANGGGNSIGQWICLAVCVLGGVWLVTGLIRAFSGGGGGGGYGGGGGGGFASGLMGGLFGAMAGAYLYNSMFGDHSSSANAADNTSGDYSGDTGAGDFSGDTGTGGSFGGGDTGAGGDFGGGDMGGGGDFGGGDF